MKKCPIVVAKEIVGAHFSRDFDDDGGYDDMVTIGGKTIAANGGIHFYISCKLLDNARNEIHEIPEDKYKIIFTEYYPWIDPGKHSKVTGDTMFKHVIDKSQISDLLKKQIADLESILKRAESKSRTVQKRRATTTVDEGPPQLSPEYTPEDLHTWLKSAASWLLSCGYIVPRIRKKPTKHADLPSIEVGPVSSSQDYKETISKLMETEVRVCKYASEVEDYYVYAANYINDLLDASRHK